jgi:carbonic anhydrase/acetyltransferase-like protein (isoleucine patch superfamily)
MPLYRLGERVPRIDPSAWVHESAVLIGAVVLGARASVWPNAVLRADNEPIEIGEETNIQDGCVLHCDPGAPVRIGARVSVGHMAMLHGCEIGDDVLVGIQAVVLNGAGIARGSVLGAGALLTEKKQIPEDSVAVGSPAKVVRPATAADLAIIRANAASYVRRAALFRAELTRI